MNKKKLIVFDITLILALLGIFIAICILNPKFFVVPLICFIVDIFIIISSYFPFIWNTPIDIDKLNQKDKEKVTKLMLIIINSFKIIIMLIILFYSIDKIFNIDTIFIIILISMIIFCFILLICVYKICKFKK